MIHGTCKGLVFNMDADRQNITWRMDRHNVPDQYLALLCYDWSNWSEHYEWCMTAPISEIIEWADPYLRDEDV